MEVAAAALAELVLLGRVGSVPETGFMSRKGKHKLVVLSADPVGAPALDGALVAMMSMGTKPRDAFGILPKVWKPVASAVQEALIERGVIRREGRFGGLRSSLWIVDGAQQRDAIFRLNAAWLTPEAVSDIRDAVFVDLMRNADDRFNRGAQRPHGVENAPVIERDWYPPEICDALIEIFAAERATAGPGAGYES
ncbi:GPP34 family phosphoprotein [Salinibacterium sp. SYSU T00001]|nr:GPP34 family phosphoprotein [Salinibacterium sedimenticola]